MALFEMFVAACIGAIALCVIVPVAQFGARAAKATAAQRAQRTAQEAQARAAAERQAERERQEAEKKAEHERAAAEKARIKAEKEAARAAKAKERARALAEKEAAQIAKEQERARIQAEKLQAAREIAEYNERALKAAKELVAIKKEKADQEAEAESGTAQNAGQAARDDASEAREERAKTISSRKPSPEVPRPFSGQVVSFTGRLQSMRRAEAIQRVKNAGGRAFADFPAGTTLLVVGANPGQKKLDKFDNWIGQVRKITEAQFLEMLKGA